MITRHQCLTIFFCKKSLLETHGLRTLFWSTLGSEWNFTSQYRVWPPPAFNTATHLLRIEDTYRWITCPGILFHSSSSAVASCKRFWGWGLRILTLLPNSSQTCSIGERSGDFEGQSSMSTLFWFRNSLVARAVWAVALSCWNVRPGPLVRRYGSTTGERISSLYLWDVKVPFTTTSLVRFPPQIPPQTITLPPPNLSTFVTQQPAKRSPRLLQTRVLPSANFKLKRDSSLKRTLDQSCTRKRKWCRAQFRREVLCRSVSSVPLYGLRAFKPQRFSLWANPPN